MSASAGFVKTLARARRAPRARRRVRHGERLQEAVERVRVLASAGERRRVGRHIPLGGDHLRHRVASARVRDCRLEERRPRQPPKLLVQVPPAEHGAGHRDAERPLARDPLLSELAKKLLHARVREVFRRATRAIVAVQLLRRPVPHLGHQVAAHPVHHRLDHALAEVGRDGAVDGGAARLQHVQRANCGQRLRRRRHAVLRVDRAAARKWPAGRPRAAADRRAERGLAQRARARRGRADVHVLRARAARGLERGRVVDAGVEPGEVRRERAEEAQRQHGRLDVNAVRSVNRVLQV